MSKYRSALNTRDYHLSTLRGACGVLLVLLMIALMGWILSPRHLTIHNPPDLRVGSTRPWWEISPSSIYSFAFYIFQQLNSWPKNGETDYPYRIATLTPYLTPACLEWLNHEMKQRKGRGELKERVRGVSEVPGRGYKDERVTVESRDSWIVRLDLVADEYYHTEPVKRVLVRYSLKIVRWDQNSEDNPFGLALDCYADAPQRLEAALVAPAEKKGLF